MYDWCTVSFVSIAPGHDTKHKKGMPIVLDKLYNKCQTVITEKIW